MSVYNAASSSGNIIGPLVFNSKDAPEYLPGLRSMLGIFVAMAASSVIQAANLAFLNKLQERRRVRNGKPAKIKDTSMDDEYQGLDAAEAASPSQDAVLEGTAEGVAAAQVENGHLRQRLGENAFADITDRQNDEFIYVL